MLERTGRQRTGALQEIFGALDIARLFRGRDLRRTIQFTGPRDPSWAENDRLAEQHETNPDNYGRDQGGNEQAER
jgi:hypothetical protein